MYKHEIVNYVKTLFVKNACFSYIYSCSRCIVVGLKKSTYCSFVPVDRLCSKPKELLHMLFHVLGRYHEHERPDRDKYIDIIQENIIEGIHKLYTHHEQKV